MEPGLGVALRKLRDRRTLSIRELSRLSGVDHAYIYRLEEGEKSSPSEDRINALLSNLKATAREAAIVKWLVEHPDTWTELVEFALDDATVTVDEFTMAAGVRHRGAARPTPAVLLERIRRALALGD